MLRLFNQFRFERMRKQALKAGPPAFIKSYLENPLPDCTVQASEAPLLAVDLETNGLNHKRDHILSIGCVQVDHAAISITTAQHVIINSEVELQHDIVPIHQITDDMIRDGLMLPDALEMLFEQLNGRILLAHNAQIEADFLSEALKNLFQIHLPIVTVDTFRIERQLFEKTKKTGSLRLKDIRKRYGLPSYHAHHALTDALSAAEVYLAQCSHSLQNAKLSDVLDWHF